VPDSQLLLTHSGRHALSGALPQPRFTSLGQGWQGIILEFFSGVSADFTAVFEHHGITVHLDGCMNVYQRFEGKTARTQMRRGNVIISPAHLPKSFQHQGGGDFVVVHIPTQRLARIAQQDNPRGAADNIELRNVFCTRDQNIERLTLQLCDELRTQDLASGICAESIGDLLAIHLLRKYSSVGYAPRAAPGKLSAKALKRALDYIEANLANDLTIHEIATMLTMSTSHFAHAFKISTGIAPHRYVIERRVELAKTLLRDTSLSIAHVAGQVGFSTHSHFCTTFQRVTAESPRAFRRRLGY